MADLKQQLRTSRRQDVKALSERPDNDTLLRLYALYKQGSEGDVSGDEARFLRLRRHGQVRGLGEAQGHHAGRGAEEVRGPGEEAGRLSRRFDPTPSHGHADPPAHPRRLAGAVQQRRASRNVTTNHIADELEISPGNLYYHFRNKDDIIEQLFARYEERMDTALVTPDGRLPELEDIWLQLHLVFECIWDYRFLYRDLVDILSRNRRLRLRFARILKRADDNAHRR